MNTRTFRYAPVRLPLAGVLAFSCWILPSPSGPCPAATALEKSSPRMVGDGVLLHRAAPGTPFQPLGKGATLKPGELLVGLPGSGIESADGSVHLLMSLDLFSPLPVLEPAVILHETPGFDLDFTLDRGRVDVVSKKEKGTTRVKVRVRSEVWELTLEEPGTRVALEVYGRWPAGVPFTKEPGPKDVPAADLLILVIEGQVDLKYGATHHSMSGPPGPAIIEWDSETGMDRTPHHLKEVPQWAGVKLDAAQKAKVEKLQEMIGRFRKESAHKSMDEILEEYLQSDDPAYRRGAIIMLAAMDNLPRLGQFLSDFAVLALRHWIGRGPGQDQRLYKGLIEKRKMTPGQAETVLQFLHGFSETDLARPETYEMLIAYLGDEQLPIRGLAYWHLVRLVPAGRKIRYDPMASKEERDRARDEWKKLIPPGQVPPRPGKEGK